MFQLHVNTPSKKNQEIYFVMSGYFVVCVNWQVKSPTEECNQFSLYIFQVSYFRMSLKCTV